MDAKLWNQSAGHGWVAVEAAVDAMFAAFDELLLEGVAARRVLDVGCGTGSTSVAAMLRLGADCVGIDPSAPMIAAARARMERCGVAARFVPGDAQTYPFDPSGFDLVLSRFGVMFFADPLAAFANLRRAAAPGGRLRFAAWRDAGENSFMTAAERAAAPLLPGLPARKPDAPGQFAFADRARVDAILKKSGWTDIDIRPIDVACRFAETELMQYLTWMGPVGRALQQADEGTRARVMDVVRPAFDPFVQGDEVRFTSACWMVDAHV